MVLDPEARRRNKRVKVNNLVEHVVAAEWVQREQAKGQMCGCSKGCGVWFLGLHDEDPDTFNPLWAAREASQAMCTMRNRHDHLVGFMQSQFGMRQTMSGDTLLEPRVANRPVCQKFVCKVCTGCLK
jgi:hypothetical protein